MANANSESSTGEELAGLLRELENLCVQTRSVAYRTEMLIRKCSKCQANNIGVKP